MLQGMVRLHFEGKNRQWGGDILPKNTWSSALTWDLFHKQNGTTFTDYCSTGCVFSSRNYLYEANHASVWVCFWRLYLLILFTHSITYPNTIFSFKLKLQFFYLLSESLKIVIRDLVAQMQQLFFFISISHTRGSCLLEQKLRALNIKGYFEEYIYQFPS